MPHFQSSLDSKRKITKFHHPLKQPINPFLSTYHEDCQQQPIEAPHRSTTSFSKKQRMYQFNSIAPPSPTQSTSSISTIPSPMTTISNGSSLSSTSCPKTIDEKSSSDPPTTTFSKPSWSKKTFSFATTSTTASHPQSDSRSKKSFHSQRKQFLTPHSYYPWFIKLDNDEKHHPFDPDRIPYWLSYEPEVLDHYILMMYASSNDPFRLPLTGPSNSELPKLILDLGCGPYGTWSHGVFQKYSNQTDLKIIGLDICPVQSVLQGDCAHQLEFIQHDFLNQLLPFPDDTFDHIHSSFIATGVPEDKWSKLLEEILRVLKPGKKLELIETNLNPNLKTYEIIDTRFISPFPLSIIPAQLSMLDDGSSVERRRIDFEEINQETNSESTQNIFILESDDVQPTEKKIKRSKKSLDLKNQMISNWSLLNHTHQLSLKASQARGINKQSNQSKPTPVSTFTDTTSGMISKQLIERFGWNPDMDLHSFQSLKTQYKHYSAMLTAIEIKISNYKTILKTFYNTKDLSLITTNSASEKIQQLKETIDKLLVKKSEIKKLFQMVRSELFNVKKRLGCEIELGYCLGGTSEMEKNSVVGDDKVVNASNSIRIESFLVSKN